jgi:hypothetical protein
MVYEAPAPVFAEVRRGAQGAQKWWSGNKTKMHLLCAPL